MGRDDFFRCPTRGGVAGQRLRGFGGPVAFRGGIDRTVRHERERLSIRRGGRQAGGRKDDRSATLLGGWGDQFPAPPVDQPERAAELLGGEGPVLAYFPCGDPVGVL